MSDKAFRIEHDSMGELQVPEDALWGAQTQRAVNNFPISGLAMPRQFIAALGLVKWAAAGANAELGLIKSDVAIAIQKAALAVSEGDYDEHFPIDVFQTGSGTSSNMNANEVISHIATAALGAEVHPNDHVNMSQSSNDVIPTCVHVSAALAIHEKLLPALRHLSKALEAKADETRDVVKTGRTHLMDAMPVTLGQEIDAWRSQVDHGAERINDTMKRLTELAQGGTAVGTGINAHPKFGEQSRRSAGREDRRAVQGRRQPVPVPELPGRSRGDLGAVAGTCRQPDQDLQRPALDELGAARRYWRNCPAGTAAGVQHHAGQGQSGHT